MCRQCQRSLTTQTLHEAAVSEVMIGRHSVAIIVFKDAQVLDVTGPVAVLQGANKILPPNLGYDVTVVSTGARLVQMNAPITLSVEASLGDCTADDFHTVLVAGGMPGSLEAMQNAALIGFVDAVARKGRRIGSVCTGAFVLGAAGLLNNRKCTTHWSQIAQLSSLFPAAQVLDDVIFHCDGNVWTSAGITTGIDMTLAMVMQDFGSDAALKVAKDLVLHLIRPGQQRQISDLLNLPTTQQQRLRDLMLAIATNPREQHDVASMAARCNMSQRTLARRFKDEFGETPARMVRRARVETACSYLRSSSHSMKRIACLSGFSSVDLMRKAFVAELGVSLSRFREALAHGQDTAGDERAAKASAIRRHREMV